MNRVKNGPKILIATPIHKSKDYAMEKWLRNLALIQKEYPADLLMIDNSLTTEYVEIVKGYCTKYRVKNYEIRHLELSPDKERFERIARSREVIREYFLARDYDVWFSWENDILIPPDSLGKLVGVMRSGNFMTTDHNCWMRGFGDGYCTDFGICLINREALKKYSFILKFGTDPEMPKTYEPSEVWFKRRILRDGGSCCEVEGVINPVIHLNVEVSPKMKVLIGTPIHEVKDYSMERWLENVSRQEHPAELFIVDNSPDIKYVEKVKMYCNKAGITNYEIVHIELPPTQGKFERIARSRELIRQHFLAGDYEAWFTWECDQIIPWNTLDKLIEIMKAGDYMMVNPNKWNRENPEDTNTDFGCCLINREALEKYGFLNPPDNNWEPGEAWFKRRVIEGGGSYINVYGVIDPIYHLNKLDFLT